MTPHPPDQRPDPTPYLVDWLRAQLDDDERTALAAAKEEGDGSWFYDASASNAVQAESYGNAVVIGPYGYLGAQGQHIARWDPERVLAEVEAKRRILDRCRDVIPKYPSPSPDVDYYGGVDACEEILRLLAEPYADREGYREEWRP